jgi:hypothetical protein
MDPLSIIAAAGSLAKLCSTTVWELNHFINDTKLVGTATNILCQEVNDFGKMLALLQTTIDDSRIQDSIQSTGLIGGHWVYLKTSLDDAMEALSSLEASVARVNRTVSVLDSARKQIRLRAATGEIEMYQQRIRSFHTVIDISFQSALL